MDKVEAAYKKVMDLWRRAPWTSGLKEEFDVAVSELMVAVMEMTAKELEDVHETRMVLARLDDSLRQLQRNV